MSEPGRSGWTEAERASLRTLARYAIAIFAAVSLTLVAVAVVANVLQIST